MADYISTAYPNYKTQAQLDALTKKTILDFAPNTVYQVAVPIGVKEVSAGPPKVYATMFILRTKYIGLYNLIADQLEFSDYVSRGGAYAGGDTTFISTTTTAPATTTVP